jgi:minor extracellular serine protease Vpr
MRRRPLHWPRGEIVNVSRPVRRSRTLILLAASLAAAGLSLAQTRPSMPASRLAAPAAVAAPAAGSRVEVVVRLSDAPLAAAQGQGAKQEGMAMNRAQAQAWLGTLRGKQDATLASIRALGGAEVARLTKALNAVIVSIDAARLPAVAALPGVISVQAVRTYQHDLAETVPYIGAAAVQAGGRDGTGVKVAVLDSGIDYTHRNLGGAGTAAAYAAAYGAGPADPKNTSLDGLFPTAKVVAGFDFVGEQWPNGARTEDPDPIDFEGHGTHVADIIAGKSSDGTHKGVAPGASLVALKVCSAIASSCNGVALLKAMEFALDPNGDGDIADAVDVVNMSLGSSYGQIEDDLSAASANASRFGVVVVASAGNSADRPFIVGSPSSTPEVISVAQTQVPSAQSFALVINAPPAIAGTYTNTETVSWAPLGSGFTGLVTTAGNGCSPANFAGFPAGRVAFVDRGACNISAKTRNASDAGAIGVIVGLVAAGDAVTFSNGGECPATPDGTCKPTLIVTQSVGTAIKANAAAGVSVTVSPAVFTSLVGSMVGSSSRGPSASFTAIKPDIGAPGASVSAIAGSGTATEAFGGTSGAAPMVSGAAALLLQASPSRTPAQIKAMLMNSAELNIVTNPATQPGVLAPVTRIGAGEVRVARALDRSALAYDARSGIASLSFGYEAVVGMVSMTQQLEVANLGPNARTFSIARGFRYANDAAGGAVVVSAPNSVSVPANSTRTVPVTLTIDAAKLPAWNLNGGSSGGNGALLQGVEFDGYLTLSDDTGTALTVPWHVLPHRAAAVTPSDDSVALRAGAGSVTLTNPSTLAGRVEVFALTGTSPRIGASKLPQPGDNAAVIDLKSVGVRLAGSALQFAINTHGERAHPNYPAEFDIYIDANRDGVADVVVFNGELGTFASSGQNVVNVLRLNPDGSPNGAASAFFFTDADLRSANAVLTVPLSAVGVTAGQAFDFSVYAFDNYFTGALTDAVEGMTFTGATPRYAASAATLSVPAGGSIALGITAPAGGAAASPSQRGLLLMYRDGAPKQEASTIDVRP